MANYLARVELHKATYDDYETLHEAMRQRNFSRVIVSNDKKKYRLPTGTYVVENTSASLEQAYTAAVAAAAVTGRSSWTIVADWQAARFSLEEVK